MDDTSSLLLHSMSTRVDDYLSDKLQSAADLSTVNELLARVHEQQDLLKKQLVEAQEGLAAKSTSLNNHRDVLRDRAVKHQFQQAKIDKSLQDLTQSNVSDEAVKIFESRMEKVRRLEIAAGYVETLQQAEVLSSHAQATLPQDHGSALQDYVRLREVVIGIQLAQPAAEGAAPHLLDHIEKLASALHDGIETRLEADFSKTLEKMAWPSKDLKLLGGMIRQWHNQVESLLNLQEAGVVSAHVNDLSILSTAVPVVLLPLQIMVQPLALRFQYHFYGQRPTNRLDKPEYFFSHILDLVERHSSFLNKALQPLLDERMSKNERLESVYSDATSAFITALLPTVLAKCLSLLPQIITQPQLLSHFLHETMSFDNILRDTWAYTPFPGSFEDWKGLTWDILDAHGYFDKWLEVEKDFALARYKNIRDSPESGQIDYDGVEEGRTKPTKGAIRVNDLLETVTSRYQNLSSFGQKMRFLMDVQLFVFDDYHNHLHGVLQAFLVSSHTAGRLIQGKTADDALGMKGLETLVKVYGSSEFLERKMSDWSDDVFFLELWDELQDRARDDPSSGGSVGQGLSVDEIAAKTSSTIKEDSNLDSGALFDETAAAYRSLRERSEAEIGRALEINVRSAMSPFVQLSIWSSLSSTGSSKVQLTPTPALDSLLNTLSLLLGFLFKVMASAPLRRMTRQACLFLEREILASVMKRHTFSAAGAAQLARDVDAIQSTIDASIHSTGEARRSMRKLEEALTLISLPIKASARGQRVQDEDQTGWDFEDEATDDKHALELLNTGDATREDTLWGLWEAEKAIFASNESARTVLTSMKLDLLTESEARNLIKRRVEINS